MKYLTKRNVFTIITIDAVKTYVLVTMIVIIDKGGEIMVKVKKLIFNRSGKYYGIKVCIPNEWASFLNITPDDPKVIMELRENSIIIRKGE